MPRATSPRQVTRHSCWIFVVALALACSTADPEPATPRAQPAPAAARVDVASALESVDTLLRDTPIPDAATAVGHTFYPARRDFGQALLRQIRLPAGFTIQAFATGLGGPHMIAAAEDGAVYVTRPDSGDVVLLRDTDGDGRADDVRSVVTGIDGIHGVAADGSRLYLVDIHNIYVAERRADGTVGTPRTIVDTLPDGGQHPNRTLAVGPDGMLYITVGSQSNQAVEPAEMTATILRSRADGSGLEIVARNLRNTLGFGWHPETRELWAMDHGIDWLGDDEQLEELNRIVEGGNYGWPHCYEDRVPNPTRSVPEGWDSMEDYCATTVPMTLGYTAHAAPMGMAFYTGSAFPAEYRGDAFVAMRGSWNRWPPSGYEVVRIRFDDGRPVAIEPFATGWLIEDGRAHFGRLVGLTQHPDGSILVTDDTNGVVYRIAYGG